MFSTGPQPPSAAVPATQAASSGGVRIHMTTFTHADAESDLEANNMTQKASRHQTTTTESDINDELKHSPI